MSKFPVEINDQEGIAEAVNYLLSGPAGLGQNFAGFSSYQPAWLTGNFRIPFTQNSLAELYVPAVDVLSAEMLDDRTVKLTFTSPPQPTPPFSLGNGLSVSGLGEPYDTMLTDDGTQIGVVSCTTTYVIIRLQTEYPLAAIVYPLAGKVSYTTTGNFFNSTDCNARVTVTGGSDRVFISAQLNQDVYYNVITGPAELQVTVAINRYSAFPNNNPTNPDYLFASRTTIAQKVYTYSGLGGGNGVKNIETIFTSQIDQPQPAYYWYILEVKYRNPTGDLQVTDTEFGLRSLSAQVVKQ